MAISIVSLYRQLFGKRDPQEGTVIDMAEHGRIDGLSTKPGFKNVNPLSPYVTLLDYNSGTLPVYIGQANADTATSEAKWQIKKLTYDGNDNVTSILAAGGTLDFNQVWDDRASLSYS